MFVNVEEMPVIVIEQPFEEVRDYFNTTPLNNNFLVTQYSGTPPQNPQGSFFKSTFFR